MTTAEYRLPVSAVPRRYELELAPDLGAARFDGTVTVTVDVLEPVRALTLNAAELTIDEARLQTPDGRSLDARVAYDEAEQQVTLSFAEEVAAATGCRLDIRYRGILNDQLHGFYRSTFRGEDGTEHVIATTQFEPADARRAFPCWDEPGFKAVFAVRLIVGDGLTALSNGSEVSSEDAGGGRRRITFQDTMVMSTYLVAFVVGPFELTQPNGVDGVPIRVAAVPGKLQLAGYAVDAATHALGFLSRYFEIPYPSDKIDHIAVPDFAFGAMENLGCVTYRENTLLVDPAAASQLELQRVATVIAHETAHMWFGDLVTMKWWNGIWLNEAFATFMELTTTEAYKPDWQVWTAFGAGKSAAMTTDGLRSTRPVEFAVGRPEEAEAMFDVLTYQKGGAVLRMLEQYLGAETFRKGINHYLTTHAYANTETTDLWDAIEAVSGEPVRAIMDSWIQQGGYPLISAAPGDEPGVITLRQRRFLYDGSESGERWAVPINLRASIGGTIQRQRILLDRESTTVSFDGPIDWVGVNDGAWGFYRVRYAPELLDRLRTAGLETVCTPLERLGLVIDTWAAVVAEMAGLDEWVGVVGALGDENDPDVWAGVSAVLGLLQLVADETDTEALRRFVRRLAGPAWTRFGWDAEPGEGDRAAIARGRLLGLLGMIGTDPTIQAEAAERFRRFLADPAALVPDLVGVTARIVVAAGGEDEWSTVLARYREASNPQEKLRYLYALAETTDPALVARTLDLIVDPEVRIQDAPFLMNGVMAQPAGSEAAWRWLESHWSDVEGRFPTGLLARMVDGIVSLVDPGVAEEVHAFCASHDIPLAGPRLDQLLERMDINVRLARRLTGTLTGALGA